MHEDVRAALTATLVREAAPSGGWGYVPGKAPRLEPTLWALAALAHAPDLPHPFDTFAAPHLRFVEQAQQPDGLLVDAAGMPPNLASNGLAGVVVASVAPTRAPFLARMLNAVATMKGLRVANEPGGAQNNELQAWPWVPDTFSWVEPTAWCVLALKKAGALTRPAAAAARLQEAEAMLRDRQCATGGWNYGNASVLGQDLRPYVPTTAVALLALQDQQATRDVQKALGWLDPQRRSEPSTMALALAALALRISGRPVDDLLQHVADGVPRTASRGNLHHQAMALCALTLDLHDGSVFRV